MDRPVPVVRRGSASKNESGAVTEEVPFAHAGCELATPLCEIAQPPLARRELLALLAVDTCLAPPLSHTVERSVEARAVQRPAPEALAQAIRDTERLAAEGRPLCRHPPSPADPHSPWDDDRALPGTTPPCNRVGRSRPVHVLVPHPSGTLEPAIPGPHLLGKRLPRIPGPGNARDRPAETANSGPRREVGRWEPGERGGRRKERGGRENERNDGCRGARHPSSHSRGASCRSRRR